MVGNKRSTADTAADAHNVDELYDDKDSTLYAILPTSIRRRLKRISGLRKSVAGYSRPLSSYSVSSGSTASSGLGTPPPEYTSRVSLSEPTSDSEFEESPNDLYGPRIFAAAEVRSGIRWKFANQGRYRYARGIKLLLTLCRAQSYESCWSRGVGRNHRYQ